jgi:hypothetical protein
LITVFVCWVMRTDQGRLRTVVRRIFGRKRQEVAGGWRKLRNEELLCLYFTRNIITVNKSKRMRWTGRVAHMG